MPSPASTASPPTRHARISPLSTPIEMCTWLGRPIFTPCRLSIAPACAGGHHLVPHKIAAERPARAARRRILDDAHARREHPAVDGRLVAAALGAKTEHAVARRRRRLHAERVERVRIDRRAVDRAPRRRAGTNRTARRTTRPAPAGRCRRPPACGRPSAAAAPAAIRRSDRKTSAAAASSRRRLRSPARHVSATGVGPDAEAEDEPLRARRDHARARQRERAADRRMPRHRHLGARREDAHAARRCPAAPAAG